jgi:hypothetical protein
MEQRVSYIFIYYRMRLLKGSEIFDATGTNLEQKLLFQYTKMFIMNTAIKFKQ